MSTLKMLVTVAYIIICIAIVIVVLMQEGKTNGLGALGGAADTYWSKNNLKNLEIINKVSQTKKIHILMNLMKKISNNT